MVAIDAWINQSVNPKGSKPTPMLMLVKKLKSVNADIMDYRKEIGGCYNATDEREASL